jgi:hypothetical protein
VHKSSERALRLQDHFCWKAGGRLNFEIPHRKLRP